MMTDNAHIGTLEMLVPTLVGEYERRTGAGPNEAVRTVYASKLYELLEKEETKLWHLSSVTLCDILERELRGEPLDIPVEG
jgi:hypothetical protein